MRAIIFSLINHSATTFIKFNPLAPHRHGTHQWLAWSYEQYRCARVELNYDGQFSTPSCFADRRLLYASGSILLFLIGCLFGGRLIALFLLVVNLVFTFRITTEKIKQPKNFHARLFVSVMFSFPRCQQKRMSMYFNYVLITAASKLKNSWSAARLVLHFGTFLIYVVGRDPDNDL